MGRRIEIMVAAALTASAIWAGQARAGEAEAKLAAEKSASELRIELNKLADTGAGGCRLTFVVSNATGGDIPQPRYEFVLFDADGLVERLTTFDFGALEASKTSVRQFDLAGIGCARLGRILVNGPSQCGEGAAAHCSATLALSSRSAIPLVQ